VAATRKFTPSASLVVGTAVVAAGAVSLFFRKKGEPGSATDAPHWTLDSASQGERPVIGSSILIGKPRQEVFQAWTEFERFPLFMENVRRVSVKDGRSLWEIEGPGGKAVTLRNRITHVEPGKEISWQSDEDSDVANAGKVRLTDAPAGRGTYVNLILSYEPPAGLVGRGIAKLFQREPAIQARRDLRRFKQLMETGEVTTNASPSGRSSEEPTESRI
jgi:uncharacterized membrane protein